MKIYTQDHNWAGSISVIAENEEQAREFLAEHPKYRYELHIEVSELVPGVIHCNLGDL